MSSSWPSPPPSSPTHRRQRQRRPRPCRPCRPSCSAWHRRRPWQGSPSCPCRRWPPPAWQMLPVRVQVLQQPLGLLPPPWARPRPQAAGFALQPRRDTADEPQLTNLIGQSLGPSSLCTHRCRWLPRPVRGQPWPLQSWSPARRWPCAGGRTPWPLWVGVERDGAVSAGAGQLQWGAGSPCVLQGGGTTEARRGAPRPRCSAPAASARPPPAALHLLGVTLAQPRTRPLQVCSGCAPRAHPHRQCRGAGPPWRAEHQPWPRPRPRQPRSAAGRQQTQTLSSAWQQQAAAAQADETRQQGSAVGGSGGRRRQAGVPGAQQASHFSVQAQRWLGAKWECEGGPLAAACSCWLVVAADVDLKATSANSPIAAAQGLRAGRRHGLYSAEDTQRRPAGRAGAVSRPVPM